MYWRGGRGGGKGVGSRPQTRLSALQILHFSLIDGVRLSMMGIQDCPACKYCHTIKYCHTCVPTLDKNTSRRRVLVTRGVLTGKDPPGCASMSSSACCCCCWW